MSWSFARAGPAPPGSRTRGGRWSRDDLPIFLVAIQLLHRVGIERMVALRDVHVLGLAAQRRGEVALARVVDDGDDGGKLGVPAGQLEGGGDIAAARDAAEDPLVPGEPAGGLDALLGGGGDDPGQLGDVEIARHKAVADALDAVMPPRAGRDERALRGLDRSEERRVGKEFSSRRSTYQLKIKCESDVISYA